MEEGDAITLEDGELTIQIRRAPPKVNKMINIKEYSQWLAFNPRKRWGSNIFSSGCEEGSAWWEGKFRDKVGYCPFCKAYIVQHLEKFNVCFFKKPILCFNKSATFIALSLVNLISDKETIIVIIIIIRVTTTSENKFSKGEGLNSFGQHFTS